mgnify:CR=1 FL=1
MTFAGAPVAAFVAAAIAAITAIGRVRAVVALQAVLRGIGALLDQPALALGIVAVAVAVALAIALRAEDRIARTEPSGRGVRMPARFASRARNGAGIIATPPAAAIVWRAAR